MSIYWIDDRMFPGVLGIMARPRAGDWLEDEIARWRGEKVGLVVSLLERSEVAELELERERDSCRANGIDFRSFPIVDRGVPGSMRDVETLCGDINDLRKGGRRVAVHCRAGIGRSSLIAASSLVAGVGVREAFDLISTARRLTVPDTPEQVTWVEKFAFQLKR